MKNMQIDRLLSSEERAICKLIAKGGAPHCQRAEALLALHQDSSQAEASRHSGLTVNQIRYWLGRFRSRHLGIFPDEILATLRDKGSAKAAAIKPGIKKKAATGSSKSNKKDKSTKTTAKKKEVKKAKKKNKKSNRKGKSKASNSNKKARVKGKKKSQKDKNKTSKDKKSKKKKGKR